MRTYINLTEWFWNIISISFPPSHFHCNADWIFDDIKTGSYCFSNRRDLFYQLSYPRHHANGNCYDYYIAVIYMVSYDVHRFKSFDLVQSTSNIIFIVQIQFNSMARVNLSNLLYCEIKNDSMFEVAKCRDHHPRPYTTHYQVQASS